MIDVLIFPGYGSETYPDYLLDHVPDFPRNRVGKIIDRIREVAISLDYQTQQDLLFYLKNHNQDIIQSKSEKDLYYYWNRELRWIDTMQIVSVNTLHYWNIDADDGKEYIVYMTPVAVDDRINYTHILRSKDPKFKKDVQVF